MVLTVRVRMGDERAERARYSRRTVLRAALVGTVGTASTLALTGCDRSAPAQVRKIADPLNPLYRDTAALLARHESIMTARPELAARLTPLRDAHREHLRALAREIGPNLASPSPASPSPAASAGGSVAAEAPADAGSALAVLRDAEKAAAAAARAACLAGPSYRAALLGSIAAARASHVEALS
jgi:hypothetical protein